VTVFSVARDQVLKIIVVNSRFSFHGIPPDDVPYIPSMYHEKYYRKERSFKTYLAS